MPGESEARLGQGGSRTARCPRMQGLCPLHGRFRRSPGVRRENTKAQGWVPLQAQLEAQGCCLGIWWGQDVYRWHLECCFRWSARAKSL